MKTISLFIFTFFSLLLNNLNGFAQVIYSQRFDAAWSTSVTSLGWTGTASTQGAWHRDDNFSGWSNSGGPGNAAGGHAAMCDNYNLASGSTGYMQSANINLSGSTCTNACAVTCAFYYYNPNNDNSQLTLAFSNDGGASFSNTHVYPSNTGSSGWTQISTPIPSTYLVSNFQLQFTYKIGYGTINMGVDEVVVTALTSSTATWLTTGTTDWGTATNWSGGVVPNLCTSVTIPSGTNQPIIASGTSAGCSDLTINNGGSLTVNTTVSPFFINGNVTVNAGATFTTNGSFYVRLSGVAKTIGGAGTWANIILQIKTGASYTLSSSFSYNALYIESGASLSLSSYTLTMITGNYTPAITQLGTLNLNTGNFITIAPQSSSTFTPSSLNHNTGTFTYDMSGSAGNYYWSLQDNDYNNIVITTASGYFVALNDGTVTSFNLNGSLTISSNSTFENGYNTNSIPITLQGNWTNNGTFTPYDASSSVTFNGSGSQTIGGTTSSTFKNLIINNTAALSSGVSQAVNVQVANTMTLTKGAYNLNSHTLTIQNSSASAVTGSSSSSFIVSETPSASNPSNIDWQVAAVNASFVFPFGVGSTGKYIPFTINKTAGSTADLYASTRGTASSDNLPFAGSSDGGAIGAVTNLNGGPGVTNYALTNVVDRWWDIYPTGILTADVTFSYQQTEDATTTGTTKAQHWSNSPSLDWDAPVGTGTGVFTGGVATCKITGATTFSPWVVVTAGAVLPVTFTSLSSSCEQDAIKLSWETTTETNNDYFTAERSIDGKKFTSLGTLKGSGTSSESHHYFFMDAIPEGSVAYYRIQQTDFNGQSEYSWLIPAAPCGNQETLNLSFANGVLHLITNNKKGGNFQVDVFDAKGEKVHSGEFMLQRGENVFDIMLNNANGIYFVSLSNGQSRPLCRKVLIHQ
jgi:hypothetical protein